MYEARAETVKEKNKFEVFLDYAIFPLIKKLEIEDSGSIFIEATLIRERVDENGKIKRWVRISKIDISKDKRIK